jgi:carbamoyl-phosphate synthase large subunit
MRASVLVTSAGRRAGLVECIRQSGQELGLDLTLIGAELDPDLSAACRLSDRAFKLPRADDPAYADAVLAIVRENGVGLVVPTIDTELQALAAAREAFAAAGARVHVSAPSVVDVARDKARTAAVLSAAGVPVPRTFSLDEARGLDDPALWPMMVKPSGGSASRGIGIARTPAELPANPPEEMIVQQLLKGPEYTINMFVDASGKLVSVVPHRRLRVRAGEVEKGRTERSAVFQGMAEGVLRALPEIRGAVCFQAIVDPVAGPCVFEINARFGGGYPLAHQAGATFTRWLMEEAFGLPSTANADWRDGVLMIRYDAAIYQG